MKLGKIIPFAIALVLLAGFASAHRSGTLATPQGDDAKPKPSASAQPKEKPKPKPDQPKKPPADEGGW